MMPDPINSNDPKDEVAAGQEVENKEEGSASATATAAATSTLLHQPSVAGGGGTAAAHEQDGNLSRNSTSKAKELPSGVDDDDDDDDDDGNKSNRSNNEEERVLKEASTTTATLAEQQTQKAQDPKPVPRPPTDQDLICHEEMEEFVDPTLLHRLVVASPTTTTAPSTAKAKAKVAKATSAAPPSTGNRSNSSDGQGDPSNSSSTTMKKKSVGDETMATAQDDDDNDPPEDSTNQTKPKKKKRKKDAGTGADGAAAQAASSTADVYQALPPYMYSWEALGLGHTRGSPAWNQQLRERLQQQSGGAWHDTVPQLSSEQVLDVIRSRCRLVTIQPPSNSPVLALAAAAAAAAGGTAAVTSSTSLMSAAASTSIPGLDPEERDQWLRKLSRVYGAMVAQDVTARMNRYHDVTASEVLQKLRHVENEAARLELRQRRVLELAGRVGLVVGPRNRGGDGDDIGKDASIDDTDTERESDPALNDDDDDDDDQHLLAHPKDALKKRRARLEKQKRRAERSKASARHQRRHRHGRKYWSPQFDTLLQDNKQRRQQQHGEDALYLFPHDAY